MAESIWLVTSGAYSDFGVICAAPTRELAEQICRKIGGDDVQEVPLLTSVDQHVEIVTYCGDAYLTPEGVITLAVASDVITYQFPSPPRAWNGSGDIRVEVHAKSSAVALHAVKEYATELASELAAGVPAEDAVNGFNQRYAEWRPQTEGDPT